MKKFSLLLILALILAPEVSAQTRGEGVGAMVSTTSTAALVTISDGKTAPWAEVVIQDEAGNIQAVAEIDEKGIFSFDFKTDTLNINNLYIYSTDEAGSTNPVKIEGTSLSNFILPPTIIREDEESLTSDSIQFGGYAYPGSTIRVSVSGDNGYFEIFETVAGPDGKWEILITDLEIGNYTAKASASFEGLVSAESQESKLESLPLVASVLKNIGSTVTEAVHALPEPVKETAQIASKVAAPIVTTWFFLQFLFAGLSVKDIANYGLLIVFWIKGILVKRRKGKWGVVYDAATKNPLAGAIIRLYDSKEKLIETDVTGKLGVYSFLARAGQYFIRVSRAGYDFPTKIVLGRVDGEYKPIYRGEGFEVTPQKPIVSFDIPLDPRSYQQKLGRLESVKVFLARYQGLALPVVVVVGFLLSFVAAILTPTLLNRLVVVFYILSVIYTLYNRIAVRRGWGVVVNEEGKPIKFISLSLLDTLFGRQLQRRITDDLGRFQFLTPPGKYRILVTTAGWQIVPRRGYYQGEEIEVRKQKIISPKILLTTKA